MSILSRTLVVAGILSSVSILLGGETFHSLISDDRNVVIRKEILTGSTFSVLAEEVGLGSGEAEAILASAKDIYNLSLITAGKELDFIFDKDSGEFKEFMYEVSENEKLSVKKMVESIEDNQIINWKAEKIPIEYTIKVAEAEGVMEESLYRTIIAEGLDERLALELAETFAWQIDFATQIQKGDSFKVVYEERYRDGDYYSPGIVLAAEFINDGEKFQGFYFTGGEETEDGHYDENGKSLRKIFLKAPLQYKYISSGFSYRRYNPILDKYTPHRGIDYAAPTGTPAVTVGDGTVVQAGWNGQYGISVIVRHNEVYTTVYGHFSSLAKGIKKGSRVKQGQIVGYVGSTGLSTGPHLHYEIRKFGTLINPFNEKFPSVDPIAEADKTAFEIIRSKYQGLLAKI